MAFTYNPSLPTDRDRVRFLLQDTVATRQMFDDGEIAFLLSTEANFYMAAAICAEAMVRRSRGLTSKTVGDLSLTYDAKMWTDVAEKLRLRGSMHQIPTAGGITIDDRLAIWGDPSLIRPAFYDRVLQDPLDRPAQLPSALNDEIAH